ncbi:MAG TPA: alcohol dehydrogenase catalytic domain-containing protein [Candidatus Baltobacteraceae bacterium]|jgi:threonine dehydrogenase-like Zn-dependent dehydrogenase
MKAVVFKGIGQIGLETVADPTIQDDGDIVVKLTSSAICGTDLHFVRGSFADMEPGTILGHEGVGVVEETGKGVRNLRKGDRVVVPSTIACGTCSYCRASYYSKCDVANRQNPKATAFFGGPKGSGGFAGLQAEYARVPFGNVGPVKIPDGVGDDDAILLSDIFTTAYFGAEMASIKPGHTVVVLGCGPVGQLAIASAKLFDAGRIIAVDCEPSRLESARRQGAEPVDFGTEDAVQTVLALTNGIGADCVIDAVGIDAQKEKPRSGAGFEPGAAPAQALAFAVDMAAKAAHVSIIGVYPPTMTQFPIGKAMGKNLTLRMGDCPHRRYLPQALRAVANGTVRPSRILSQKTGFEGAVAAYHSFADHEDGWLKVELLPGSPSATQTRAERGELVSA